MGCEAKLGSKRGADATGVPTSQEKNGGQEGTGCKATIKAGVVKPYGQVC